MAKTKNSITVTVFRNDFLSSKAPFLNFHSGYDTVRGDKMMLLNSFKLAALSLLALAPLSTLTASADPYYNNGYYPNQPYAVNQYNQYQDPYNDPYLRGNAAQYSQQPTYFQRHPYQKKALIGAGIGAATSLIFNNGRTDKIGRSALIGAGAGLSYEYLRQQNGNYNNQYPNNNRGSLLGNLFGF
jgi:hypothetical protein